MNGGKTVRALDIVDDQAVVYVVIDNKNRFHGVYRKRQDAINYQRMTPLTTMISPEVVE